jgi:hypothetical protein
MLAQEDDVIMIPIIGTCFRVVKEGIVPSVVIGDDTSPRFETVTALVGEGTIPTLVSV